jgi:hypothetical protein
MGDGFEARVLGSPAGETGAIATVGEGPLSWPVDYDLAGRSGGVRDIGASIVRSPVDRQRLGESLFNIVFRDEALVRFRESRRRAAERGEGIRIVLRTGPGVDGLPWELLYDPGWRRFVALDPETPLVRCVEMPTRHAVPKLDGPLRMVVAVATPADLAGIDARRELDDLSTALDRFVAAGALELVPVLDASLDDIRIALAGGDVHIFHYIGHGIRLGDGRGVLALTGPGGSASISTGDELGAVLTTSPALRLVVLNSCHGATAAGEDPFAAPAAALVRVGVPAVRSPCATPSAIGQRRSCPGRSTPISLPEPASNAPWQRRAWRCTCVTMRPPPIGRRHRSISVPRWVPN